MIDDIIIKSHLDNRSKLFMDCEKFIIFDKEYILKCINKYWLQMKQFKNIIKVENKLKRRGITVYYYSFDQLSKMDFRNFKFDEKNKPEFNKVYFKFDDYNDNIMQFFTYNNFLRISENYKYDFFVFLFSKFGLKEMNWSTTFSNSTTTSNDMNINLGIRDVNTTIEYTNNEQNSNNINMTGKKKVGNNGSLEFFNCCDVRSFWYSFCAHNLDETVKKILEGNNKYNYKYYINNHSLKNKLQNRLGDILLDDYVVTNDTEHINLIKHMMRISTKYAKIGFSFNSNNISTEKYTKRYKIEYYNRNKLELRSMEIIKSNKNLQKNIDINVINIRYNDLNKRHKSYIEEELKNLQDELNRYQNN